MLKLNLPSYNVKVKKIDDKLFVFDGLRKKYVALTPEEWVRQHFINYLVTEKDYPSTLIANEIQINLNNQKVRCDSVVYNRNIQPLMIIEYKAPQVTVNQQVFDQIAKYNIVLKVDFLIVSNGLEHYCCKIDYEKQSFHFLKDIPSYEELNPHVEK